MDNCYNCKHHIICYRKYYSVDNELIYSGVRVHFCKDANAEIPHQNTNLEGCCGFCKNIK